MYWIFLAFKISHKTRILLYTSIEIWGIHTKDGMTFDTKEGKCVKVKHTLHFCYCCDFLRLVNGRCCHGIICLLDL